MVFNNLLRLHRQELYKKFLKKLKEIIFFCLTFLLNIEIGLLIVIRPIVYSIFATRVVKLCRTNFENDKENRRVDHFKQRSIANVIVE